MFDRDMNYLAASARWIAEYAPGHASVAGLNIYALMPDMSAHWKDAHRRGLAGETLRNDADAWTRADGSTQWLKWVVQPWTDDAGAVGGLMISAKT